MRYLEILLVAAVFAACHALAPRAYAYRQRSRRTVASFSGGIASAYVFLHLIPEIHTGGELLGERIYFVLLIGLALFYGLEVRIHRRARAEIGAPDAALHIGAFGLYSAMLVFTLGQQLPSTPGMTVVFALTMGMHLVSLDLGLQELYADSFVRRGRWTLVGAVVVGCALSFVRDPREEVIDVLTALLAGFILLNVFRKELPEFREAHFGAFLLGMGLFFAAHVALGGKA